MYPRLREIDLHAVDICDVAASKLHFDCFQDGIDIDVGSELDLVFRYLIWRIGLLELADLEA